MFPLGTVLFPGLVLPLHIFEERYRTLVRAPGGLPDDGRASSAWSRSGSGWEVRRPDRASPVVRVTLHDVGCTAELRQVTEQPDGRFDIVTVGRRRFQISRDRRRRRAVPAGRGRVAARAGRAGPGRPTRSAPRVLAAVPQLPRLLRHRRRGVAEQLPDDPTVLSHLVAATAALTIADRQGLLAAADTASRLRAELRLLHREAACCARSGRCRCRCR